MIYVWAVFVAWRINCKALLRAEIWCSSLTLWCVSRGENISNISWIYPSQRKVLCLTVVRTLQNSKVCLCLVLMRHLTSPGVLLGMLEPTGACTSKFYKSSSFLDGQSKARKANSCDLCRKSNRNEAVERVQHLKLGPSCWGNLSKVLLKFVLWRISSKAALAAGHEAFRSCIQTWKKGWCISCEDDFAFCSAGGHGTASVWGAGKNAALEWTQTGPIGCCWRNEQKALESSLHVMPSLCQAPVSQWHS